MTTENREGKQKKVEEDEEYLCFFKTCSSSHNKERNVLLHFLEEIAAQ